jgi:leucyl aminopeptidase (aminopeptidase T)
MLAASAIFAAEPVALPPIDAAALARRMVGSLHPARGEAAILVADPTYHADLTRAVELELDRAGVHPVITVAFPPRDVVLPLFASEAEAARREAEWVALLSPVFEKAALFFWMPARIVPPGLALEKLVDGSRVRGVHFHWILPPEGRSVEELGAASRMYQRAVLETDYAALSAEQDRLIAALRGRGLRIRTPAGTDLRLRVAADAWFHKNDGDLPAERARRGRGARDREMELPAGALRFIPDASSTEGVLVVPRLTDRRLPAGVVVEQLRLDFRGGRASVASAATNEAAARSLFATIGGDIDKVCELVLGTNPLLLERLPSGELPYFGYGSGYLRISLGDNWESGGALRTTTGGIVWMFLEGATLEADGAALVRDGRIVR